MANDYLVIERRSYNGYAEIRASVKKALNQNPYFSFTVVQNEGVDMATRIKLTIEQGATFMYPFTWSRGTTENIVDLSPYKARMQIRPTIESSVVLAELSTENGGIQLTPENTIQIFMCAEDTAALNFDEAVYDLELYEDDCYVTRVMQGTVKLSKNVTR